MRLSQTLTSVLFDPRAVAEPPRRLRIARLELLAISCGVIALLVGAMVLIGWHTGAEELTRLRSAWPATAPTTALMNVLSGMSLIALVHPNRRWRTWLGVFAALAVTLIAAITLSESLFGWDAGIDRVLVREDASHKFPGRSSLQTSLTFLLLGSALLLLDRAPRRWARISELLVLVAIAVPILALLGYAYGASHFYAVPVLLVLGLGIFVARPASGLIGILTSTKDAALRQSLVETEHWRHFIEHANWGAAISAPDGTLRFVNEAFARMHGCTIEELIGSSVFDTFSPESRADVIQRLPVIHERGGLRFESEHVRKDGSRFPVAIDLTEVRDASGEVLYRAAYIRDISLERKAQDRFRLATLVDSSDDAVMAGTLDGTIVQWNRAAERIYGYTAEEMIGHPIAITVPQAQISELRDGLATIARGDHLRTLETVRIRKDGSMFDAAVTLSGIKDDSGRVIGASAIARDISEGKAAERELARQRAWLQAMVEQMPEPVIVLDGDGEIALQNRPAQAIACEPGRLDSAGRSLSHDIRYPSGEPVPAAALPHSRALASGESVLGAEFVIGQGERRVPVVASATPVRIESQVAGAVAIFQDVSALKELERQREEWISIVAHDLRQPISTIALATEAVLQRESPMPERARESLARVRNSVDKLGRMINDLLDASRVEAHRLTIEREPLNLRTLLEEVVTAVPELGASPVRMHFAQPAPWISADRMRIDQIFRNLLSNAGKYGTPGTPVEIAVEPRADAFEITVRNYGPGIAREDMAHLFQRFSRPEGGKRAGIPGIGLGLYITRGLVQAHGGRTWVESTPGESTTFHVVLPAQRPDALAPSAQQTT